jgi:hypothetical protein
MAELVDVVVKVPAERIADLYAMVAQLNRPINRPEPGASRSPKDETPGDLQELVRMFRDLAQDFFRHAA